jgi:translation initiation factor 1
MDLQDQLKIFPDHEPAPEEAKEEATHELYVQKSTYDLQIRKEKEKSQL